MVVHEGKEGGVGGRGHMRARTLGGARSRSRWLEHSRVILWDKRGKVAGGLELVRGKWRECCEDGGGRGQAAAQILPY